MLPKLKLIKETHAARVLELSRTALKAIREIAEIETAMDLQATTHVHERYVDCVPDFKLTFEAVYAQLAEEFDDQLPRLDDCAEVLTAIEDDAAAAAAEDRGTTAEDPRLRLSGGASEGCTGARSEAAGTPAEDRGTTAEDRETTAEDRGTPAEDRETAVVASPSLACI